MNRTPPGKESLRAIVDKPTASCANTPSRSALAAIDDLTGDFLRAGAADSGHDGLDSAAGAPMSDSIAMTGTVSIGARSSGAFFFSLLDALTLSNVPFGIATGMLVVPPFSTLCILVASGRGIKTRLLSRLSRGGLKV
jgi:hypothetical protein